MYQAGGRESMLNSPVTSASAAFVIRHGPVRADLVPIALTVPPGRGRAPSCRVGLMAGLGQPFLAVRSVCSPLDPNNPPVGSYAAPASSVNATGVGGAGPSAVRSRQTDRACPDVGLVTVVLSCSPGRSACPAAALLRGEPAVVRCGLQVELAVACAEYEGPPLRLRVPQHGVRIQGGPHGHRALGEVGDLDALLVLLGTGRAVPLDAGDVQAVRSSRPSPFAP